MVVDKRGQLSDLTLRHELQVLDVKRAFFESARSSLSLQVAEFSTWPALYQFRAAHPTRRHEILVKPDGFTSIHERERDGGTSEHTFFLELDRSTQTLETLATKAACYIDYYRAGGFALRNGALAEHFRDYPFRVLVVCKSTNRIENLLKKMLQNTPPVLTQVWFTTSAEVLSNVPRNIWRCPADIDDCQARRALFSDGTLITIESGTRLSAEK
jgi:hypothetical protein